jgi:hypothetical protein
MTAMTDATTGSFPRSAALSDDLEAPAVALYEHAAALLAVAGALQAAADEPSVGAALSPTLACLEATLEALAGSAERLGCTPSSSSPMETPRGNVRCCARETAWEDL